MTEKRRDAESASPDDEVAALTAEREAFQVRQEEVVIQIRQLREAEDPATGTYYAQEIFTLSQEKLRLEAEIDIRGRKIRRLTMPDALHGMLQ